MRCEYKRRVFCSLLALHLLQSILFGHIYHIIDEPINTVGGSVEDDKSALASVMCVGAPYVTLWLLDLHLYLASTSGCLAALADPSFTLLRLRVDRNFMLK